MNKCAFPLMLVLAAAAQPCAAGTISQTKGSATLEVRYDGDKPEIALADLIEATLTVEGGRDLIVIAPLDLPTTATWQLIERSGATRVKIGQKRIRWRLTYRFAPREPGKLEFAFPRVTFREGDGPMQAAEWNPIPFQVTVQGGELRDITAVEGTPPVTPPDRSWQLWSMAAFAGLVLIALPFALRRLLRRAQPKTPAQLALREWERLVRMRLPEQGRGERFITLLTTLVRAYLERRYDIPARRRTTPEFLQSLAEIAALSVDAKQFLARFLQRAEAIKFAQLPISGEECRQWAQEARLFLEQNGKSA